MRKYVRIEEGKGHKRITEVTETTWKTWVQWDDGIITSYLEQSLTKMGWSGLDEFLKHRGQRFVPVITESLVKGSI